MYIYNRAAVFEMDMRSLSNQVFLVFLTLTNFCLLMLISSTIPNPWTPGDMEVAIPGTGAIFFKGAITRRRC